MSCRTAVPLDKLIQQPSVEAFLMFVFSSTCLFTCKGFSPKIYSCNSNASRMGLQFNITHFNAGFKCTTPCVSFICCREIWLCSTYVHTSELSSLERLKPLKDEAFKVFGTHQQAVFNGVSGICKGGSAVLHCFSLEMVDSIGCEHDFVSH